MTKLAEKEISREMTGSRGAIVHDAWTNCGTHCLAVLASFMKEATVVDSGSPSVVEQYVMPLLSVGPMAKSCFDEGMEDHKATEFDAVTRMRQLEDLMHFTGQTYTVGLFALSQITTALIEGWHDCWKSHMWDVYLTK